ncbi:hypothetical protein HWV62_16272 [Athelia sp. TMB]|nr:hypothetical protein HWV62_16272 [Athelia sp. TMB]
MSFQPPRKCILSQEQLESFQSSKTYDQIVSYIDGLNEAVTGVKLNDVSSVQGPTETDAQFKARNEDESEVRVIFYDALIGSWIVQRIASILKVLDRVEAIANETPPVENSSSRFGNTAFRTFYKKISEEAPSLHETLLKQTLHDIPVGLIEEISIYFIESWGNQSRIDYGSGMELNFLCWLYLQIMRLLQSTYWLEPAGSHGVWGLDDYHFLPFLFGAAQLVGHKYIRPRAIRDENLVEELYKDYMFFSCIRFINSVKTWDKVNSGMAKMYRAEVLGKLPVMQHFLFGSILPYDGPAAPSDDADDTHWGHAHAHAGDTGAAGQQAGFGDCCGIPVPSVFGAARAEKRLAGVRPVPFD